MRIFCFSDDLTIFFKVVWIICSLTILLLFSIKAAYTYKDSYTYLYTDSDSYEPLAQVHNWINEDGESKQEIHYLHYDQIGIPREMIDDKGNLVWFGNYIGWGKLKSETNTSGTAYQPFRLQNQDEALY